MIFLTVGTWYKGFDRLIEAFDKLVVEGNIDEKIIAQIGYGSYEPQNFEAMDFCSPSEFAEIVAEARLVVSHAGMGSIAQTLKQGKTVIVVPRKKNMGEVSNDHQFDTAQQLEAEGKVLVAYEVEQLANKLKEAEGFVPEKPSGAPEIARFLDSYLSELAEQKM